MRIKIDKYYQSVSGVRVSPGEYDATDLPAGIAQYLVDNGHASVVADSANGLTHTDEIAEALMTGQLDTEDVVVETDVSDRELLLKQYEARYDRVAPSNISTDTLRQRVAEAQDDDTANLND